MEPTGDQEVDSGLYKKKNKRSGKDKDAGPKEQIEQNQKLQTYGQNNDPSLNQKNEFKGKEHSINESLPETHKVFQSADN